MKELEKNILDPIRLFSYKMTHDTGFAPNPFHGILTLANCKPYMRKTKQKGDWIAGFSSVELNGDKVGEERLIFLMKVTDKVKYCQYWDNPVYKNKIPDVRSSDRINKAGDNIYEPLIADARLPEDFKQINNKHHKTEDKKIKDINGNNVLISDYFFYFGSMPVRIPKEFSPDIPKGSTRYGKRTHDPIRAYRFIKYIKDNYRTGKINNPYSWSENNFKSKFCKK